LRPYVCGVQPIFAQRLTQRLKTLNQRELARRLNIDHSTVSNYASGRRQPNLETLTRLCRALVVPSDWLLGLTSDPRPSPVYPAGLVVALPTTSEQQPGWPADNAALPTETIPIGGIDHIAVAKLRDPIAAGRKAILTDGSIDAFHFIRLDWLQHRNIRGSVPVGRIIMLDIPDSPLGESMTPTIRRGATIFADRGPECDGPSSFEPGSIYLVRHSDGIHCKRVWKTDSGLSCQSDNLAVEPFMIPLRRGDLDEIRDHLAAKVFWVGNPVA